LGRFHLLLKGLPVLPFRHILPLGAIGLITACAPSPDAIAPVALGNAFAAVTCAEASAMLTAETQTLATLSAAQTGAATGDAIGVLLIGVPVSSLTGGDRSGEIAASKGKVLALESRLASC
jgi:hypothetical protein